MLLHLLPPGSYNRARDIPSASYRRAASPAPSAAYSSSYGGVPAPSSDSYVNSNDGARAPSSASSFQSLYSRSYVPQQLPQQQQQQPQVELMRSRQSSVTPSGRGGYANKPAMREKEKEDRKQSEVLMSTITSSLNSRLRSISGTVKESEPMYDCLAAEDECDDDEWVCDEEVESPRRDLAKASVSSSLVQPRIPAVPVKSREEIERELAQVKLREAKMRESEILSSQHREGYWDIQTVTRLLGFKSGYLIKLLTKAFYDSLGPEWKKLSELLLATSLILEYLEFYGLTSSLNVRKAQDWVKSQEKKQTSTCYTLGLAPNWRAYAKQILLKKNLIVRFFYLNIF